MSRVCSLSEPSLVSAPEHLLELRSEIAVLELLTKAAEQGRLVEHLRPLLLVEVADLPTDMPSDRPAAMIAPVLVPAM